MEFNIKMPMAPQRVLEQLNQWGHEAFAVGGCVRDTLLGKKPQDWDVCTSAKPDEILKCFSKERTIPTGYQHGTITVIIDEMPVEVTTYRIDGMYSDGRHPDEVSFTSKLSEDLARRDFTVNAMAYHPREGLIDNYSGIEDLTKGLLRCVGDPQKRFTEDALRILRAYRFSSQLGFVLEEHTQHSAEQLLSTVSLVAVERIYQELVKLVCGSYVGQVLKQYPFLLQMFPMMQPTLVETLEIIDSAPTAPAFRFGTIYRGNENAKEAMLQLRAPVKVAEEVAFIAKYGFEPMADDCGRLQRFLYCHGKTRVHSLVEFQKGIAVLSQKSEATLRYIEEQNLCFELKQLAVTGNDLLQAGFVADRQMGERLERLLFAVIDQMVPNEKQALIQWALKTEK